MGIPSWDFSDDWLLLHLLPSRAAFSGRVHLGGGGSAQLEGDVAHHPACWSNQLIHLSFCLVFIKLTDGNDLIGATQDKVINGNRALN